MKSTHLDIEEMRFDEGNNWAAAGELDFNGERDGEIIDLPLKEIEGKRGDNLLTILEADIIITVVLAEIFDGYSKSVFAISRVSACVYFFPTYLAPGA